MKRILFVCVENAGRSQMAEAFANHYGKEKLVASSAGVMAGSQCQSNAYENVNNTCCHFSICLW
jgi:protein-tyrosine-phosphatase